MIFKFKYHFSSFILLLSVFAIQLLFISANSSAQFSWSRAYDGPLHYYDGAYSICPADGPNIYIAGFTGGPNAGFLIKIDQYGDTIWARKINSVSDIFCVVPTGDGSCVTSGYAGTIFAMKVSPSGQTIWQKYYNGTNAYQIVRTNDNGFIGCGDASSSGLQAYVFKIDSIGNKIWDKFYSGVYSRIFTSIDLAWGNGFVVCGHTSDNSSDSGQAYLAKINDTGSIEWEKYFNLKGPYFQKIGRITNGYLIGGSKHDSSGSGNFRTFFLRTDLFGNIIIYREFSAPRNEYLKDLVALNDNRFILLTNRDTVITGNITSRLIIIDSLANIIRERIIFDDRGFTQLNSIIKAPNSINGDFVLAGETNIISGFDDFYAIRIDSMLSTLDPIGISNPVQNTPVSFELLQNYPNPFNPSTQIIFNLPYDGTIKFTIYDILGKEMYSVNENLKAGTHEIKFDGSTLASGMYFYKLESESYSETKKMVLIK